MAVRRLIDGSHTIEHRMITYAGLPGPVISDHLIFAVPAKVKAFPTLPARAFVLV
jgi:hypothetical protein